MAYKMIALEESTMMNVLYCALFILLASFSTDSLAAANDNNILDTPSFKKTYNKMMVEYNAQINGEAKPDKVITDLKNWSHPTKKYFSTNSGYKLTKVELYNKSTYPVFYVDITNNNTGKHWYMQDSYDIAKANGGWPYDIKFHYNNKYLFTLTNILDKRDKTLDMRLSYYDKAYSLSFKDAYKLVKSKKPSYFKNKHVSYCGTESGIEIYNMTNPKYLVWLRNMKADMAGTVARFLVSPDSGVIVDWDDLNM